MSQSLEKLFKGKEGNIFLLGLILTFCLLIFIIISYQIDALYASKITGIVFSNLFIGRVPALSFGYAANLSHFTVIGINIIVELILVSIILPLFILSFRGILKIKLLENFFIQVQQKRIEHQEKFNKYGKFALFVFVFIPFWMTGPIVGAIIGFLIGIEYYTIIIIVFLATMIAITLWGLFLQEIVDFLIVWDNQFLWIGLFIFVLALLVIRFKNKLFYKK